MPRTQSNLKFDALCDALENRMIELRIPGVAIGILHEDTTHYAGFGVTSLNNPLPVTADTLFQCGSISKTILATAAMSLVDEGRINLDAPIRRYLPGFALRDQQAAAGATMRHLLTHTGGWLGDHFNDFGFGADAIDRIVTEMATLPQWTPLGKYWSYNNVGFAAAARVMEMVTGQAFEDIVRMRVFEPLRMTQSFFFPTEVMVRRFAAGHSIAAGRISVATPWEIGRANHPAGGVTTTVIDLLRYAQCHIDRGAAPHGARVLSRRAAQAMRTAQLSATGRYDMGLTWWLSRLTTPGAAADPKGELFMQHGGATNGFTAHLRVVPGRRFAIAVLTNSDDGSMLYDGISQRALQDYLGLSLDSVKAVTVPAPRLKAYAGRYVAHLSEQTLTIKAGKLSAQATYLGRFPTPTSPVHGDATGPETSLAFYNAPGERIFVANDGVLGGRGEFIRDERGRIAWLRWGGRLHRRVL
jgi:CubicO group peptidase (beta-lactamase class C family)